VSPNEYGSDRFRLRFRFRLRNLDFQTIEIKGGQLLAQLNFVQVGGDKSRKFTYHISLQEYGTHLRLEQGHGSLLGLHAVGVLQPGQESISANISD
jgi:hypothetical protein